MSQKSIENRTDWGRRIRARFWGTKLALLLHEEETRELLAEAWRWLCGG